MHRFAFVLTVVLAMAAAAAAQAGTWQIDPNHSAAQFSVRHLGVSTVRGAFMKVDRFGQIRPGGPYQEFYGGDDRRELGGHSRADARQRSAQPQFP